MCSTLSIIIPVYNVAPFLSECLDSVFAAAKTLNEKCVVSSEKFNDVEIICVDDGSTDVSGAILDGYAGESKLKVEERNFSSSQKEETTTLQLQLPTSTNIPHSSFLIPHLKILHQSNQGVSAARNAGLRVAKGDWILFVDADDLVDRDWLVEIAARVGGKGDEDLVAFDKIEFGAGEKVERLGGGGEKLKCEVEVEQRSGSSSDRESKSKVEVEERNFSSSDMESKSKVEVEERNFSSSKKDEATTVQLQLSTSTKDESANLRLRLSTSTKIIDLTHAIPELMGQVALYQFAYPSALIKDIRFQPYTVGEDLLFVATVLAKARSVEFITRPLYAYRRRPGSAMQSAISPRKLRDTMRYVPEMLKVMGYSGKRIDRIFSHTRANGWLEGVPSQILTPRASSGSDASARCDNRTNLMREWRGSLAKARSIRCLSRFDHFRAALNRLLPLDAVAFVTCVLPYRIKIWRTR